MNIIDGDHLFESVIEFHAHAKSMYIPNTIATARMTMMNLGVRKTAPWQVGFKGYPIFFTYRHTLELYLKIILDDPTQARDVGHDLGRLIRAVETKLGGQASDWTRSRLHEFNDIDPTSDLFRYADRSPEHSRHVEIWVDRCQLKSVMDQLCEAFESHIRSDWLSSANARTT